MDGYSLMPKLIVQVNLSRASGFNWLDKHVSNADKINESQLNVRLAFLL